MVDLSTPPPAAPGSQQQHFQQMAAAHDDAAVQMQPQEGLQEEQHTQQQQGEDYLTASLKQQLLQDVASFFQAEIGPRSLSISEVRMVLLW
jgi:negative regulator of genetic competence, sporulation and motility